MAKEQLLIFCPPSAQTIKNIQSALLGTGVPVKIIRTEEYGKALGTLAGMDDISNPVLPTAIQSKMDAMLDSPAYPEIDRTFILICGVSDKTLDAVLAALKKAGKFPYKAVLTEINSSWSIYEAFDNVRKEHKMMTSGKGPMHR